MHYIYKSFLYSLGRFIAYVLIGIVIALIIMFIDKHPMSVFALDNYAPNSANDSLYLLHYYNNASDTPSYANNTCWSRDGENVCLGLVPMGTLSQRYISEYIPRLKNGRSYTYEQVVCSNSSNLTNTNVSTIRFNNFHALSTYADNVQVSKIQVSSTPLYSSANNTTYAAGCYKFIVSFDINKTLDHDAGSADIIGLRYDKPNTSNWSMIIFSSKLTDVGLNSGITSGVTSVVNNVNNNVMSLQSDMEELNNGINKVDNSVNKVNNSINISNQKLEQINNSLTDNTIDESDNDVSQWMGDISGNANLVSAYTNLINGYNNLKTATCSPLQFNLIGNSYELPCMSTYVYSRFSTFYAVYQAIVGGCICLACFTKWVDTFNKALDPLATNETKLAIGEL